MRKRNNNNNILFVPKGKRVYGLTYDYKIHILEKGVYKSQKCCLLDTNMNNLIFNALIEKLYILCRLENRDNKFTSIMKDIKYFIKDIESKNFYIKSNNRNKENKNTIDDIDNISYIVSEKFGLILFQEPIGDINYESTKYISTGEVDKPFEESLNILKNFKLTNDLLVDRTLEHHTIVMLLIYDFLLQEDIFNILIKNENPEYSDYQCQDIRENLRDFLNEIAKF